MGGKHLVIVGGMVPPLLLPHAHEPHIGSADIDLCLSVALTAGATRQYYASIQQLIEPHFEPASPAGHRWRKRASGPGSPLVIDFLAPLTDAATTLVDESARPDDERAQANAGVRLSPFGIRAGGLLDADAEEHTVEGVELLYRPGTRADVNVRHAGPVGFLAAKADALFGRDETKDGYDVAWWCINAGPTPEHIAKLVTERKGFTDELFPESVAELQRAFRAPDYPGPDGYARELLPGRGPDDEEFERARNRAYLASSQVIEELRKRLW